jgi:hypothetical protein
MKFLQITALALCLNIPMAHANDDDSYSLNQKIVGYGMMIGVGATFTLVGMHRINSCRKKLTSPDTNGLLESQQQSRATIDNDLFHGLLAVGIGTTFTIIGFVPWLINVYQESNEKCY